MSHSLLEQQDDVMLVLVGCVQVDDARVRPGHLQHCHLVDDVGPAVTTSPALPHKLRRKLFPGRLLHALLHHCELPPEKRKTTHTA